MSPAEEYAHQAGFPSFAPVFEKTEEGAILPYLLLLHIHDTEVVRLVLQIVRQAITQSPDAAAEVTALLADVNWRPHLAGAVAMHLGVVTAGTIAALWEALDSGSWVSPQLAVTALRRDPDFAVAARWRIEAGCPIRTERLAGLGSIVRHSVAGPSSFAGHSGKALSSLIALCRQLPDAIPWLERALAKETIQQALLHDRDGGDRLALDWQQGARSVFDRAN